MSKHTVSTVALTAFYLIVMVSGCRIGDRAVPVMVTPDQPPVWLAVHLTDHSCLTGKTGMKTLTLCAPEAKMDIPLVQIEEFEFQKDTPTCVLVNRHDGQTVSGVIAAMKIRLDMASGPVVIDMQHIRRVEVIPPPGTISVFNAAKEFSDTLNPTGVWSYGWKQRPGDAFNLYPRAVHRNLPATVSWVPAGTNIPGVWSNLTDDTIHPVDTVTAKPHQLLLHPGSGNEYCVVRWTAPKSGAIHLKGCFSGASGYHNSPR